MNKKTIFYSIFFVLLIGGFYGIVKKWLRPKDTISVVQPFTFTNQDGKKVTDADMEGKVYVAEFFFTTCRGICPRMNNYLRTVYEKYKGNPDFKILSHTCDPETDSVGQLKKYADSMQVDTRQWMFLTGRKDSLYTMARISYTIDDPANNLVKPEDDFLHTQFWALVNKHGEVKKIYDGLKQSEVDALMAEIDKLLREKE